MIRSADAYRQGLRDGHKVWIDNERMADVTQHPALKPINEVKPRIYDMPNAPADTQEWLAKLYTLNAQWETDGRRKLLAFAHDLLNSDYAGHRVTFVQFAPTPQVNHLAAIYTSFDFSGLPDFARKAASMSHKVTVTSP